jgi:hypothetical protein
MVWFWVLFMLLLKGDFWGSKQLIPVITGDRRVLAI